MITFRVQSLHNYSNPSCLPSSLLPRLTLLCNIHKDSSRTAQQTHSVSVTESSKFMVHKETIAVHSQIYVKHTNTHNGLRMVNTACS